MGGFRDIDWGRAAKPGRVGRAVAALSMLVAAALAGCDAGSSPADNEDGPVDPTRGPADGAVIRTRDETPTTVDFRIFDHSGDDIQLEFVRTGRAGGVWESMFHTGNYAHIHGPEELTLPSVEQLADQGRSAADVLHAFEPAIRDASFDDLSIFIFDGDVMAIVLWQQGMVSDVHLTGTGLLAQLESVGVDTNLCAFLRDCCTGQPNAPCADADFFPCTLATLFCDAETRSAACAQLSEWCTCGTDAIGDGNRLACAAMVTHCGADIEPEMNPGSRMLLEWIVEVMRAQIARQ